MAPARNNCADGTTCTGGICGGCPSGQSNCGGACVDLNTDANNCGYCGHVVDQCSNGQAMCDCLAYVQSIQLCEQFYCGGYPDCYFYC